MKKNLELDYTIKEVTKECVAEKIKSANTADLDAAIVELESMLGTIFQFLDEAEDVFVLELFEKQVDRLTKAIDQFDIWTIHEKVYRILYPDDYTENIKPLEEIDDKEIGDFLSFLSNKFHYLANAYKRHSEQLKTISEAVNTISNDACNGQMSVNDARGFYKLYYGKYLKQPKLW